MDIVDNLSLKDLLACGMEHLSSARLPIFSIDNATICGCELLIRGPGKLRNPELLFKTLSKSLDTCKCLESVKKVHVNLYAETILAAGMCQLISQFSQLQSSGGERKLCVILSAGIEAQQSWRLQFRSG